jgi:hypothetical protein
MTNPNIVTPRLEFAQEFRRHANLPEFTQRGIPWFVRYVLPFHRGGVAVTIPRADGPFRYEVLGFLGRMRHANRASEQGRRHDAKEHVAVP